MDVVIGVAGMLVLGGLYVALGLADHDDGCGGCILRDPSEEGCLACPETRPPEPGTPWTPPPASRLGTEPGGTKPQRRRRDTTTKARRR